MFNHKKITLVQSKYEKFIEISRRIEEAVKNIKPLDEDEKLFIFDVDHCLYHSLPLLEHEARNAERWFLEKSSHTLQEFKNFVDMGIYWVEIFYLYAKQHPSWFLEKVDNFEFTEFIKERPALVEAIKNIKHRKIIFSNAGKQRVLSILTILGIQNEFEYIFVADSIDTDFMLKPKESSYEFVEKAMGIKETRNIYFFDDNYKNINGAKLRGWNTYMVNDNIIEQIEKAHKDMNK